MSRRNGPSASGAARRAARWVVRGLAGLGIGLTGLVGVASLCLVCLLAIPSEVPTAASSTAETPVATETLSREASSALHPTDAVHPEEAKPMRRSFDRSGDPR